MQTKPAAVALGSVATASFRTLGSGISVITQLEPGDLLVAELATVEYEGQQIIPRPVRRHPINDQQRADLNVKTEFFI